MAGVAYAVLDALAGIVDAPVAMAAAVVADGALEEAYDFAHEDSRFEFGSIGKTMTAQVLAALVLDGVVSLDDPIGRWLDAGVNGEITLGQLAKHASGLPRLAPNAFEHDGFDQTDPYAHYDADLAEAGLRESVLGEPVYSNFGFQLLGLALERAASVTFGELLQAHVFTPFGLATASVGPGPNQVQGCRFGQPTPAWTIRLAGPGGVNGTLADLVAWGRAVLEPNPAMRFALANDLAWVRIDETIVWHNGGTHGGHASLFVDTSRRRIAATLVATGDLGHVDDATLVACRGGDPFETRPTSAGDEYNAAAIAFFDFAVAGSWEDARALMSEPTRAGLTVDRLANAWRETMEARGEHRATTVTRATNKGPVVEVEVALTFVGGDGKGIVTFGADGLVVGLLIG